MTHKAYKIALNTHTKTPPPSNKKYDLNDQIRILIMSFYQQNLIINATKALKHY
jgi:hypothetical protein